MRRALKVVYLAGSGRSGTTLVGRILGLAAGYVNVGELARFLFDENLIALGIPCSCGRSMDTCVHWGSVAAEVTDAEKKASTRWVRVRYIPLLLGSGRLALKGILQPVVDRLDAVYRSSLLQAGADVIVDSSKNPATAALLLLIPGIELHLVHIVRDPRAVVHSWSRRKSYLEPHSPLKALRWWYAYNLPVDAIRRRSATFTRMRYEDFVQAPEEHIDRILSAVSSGTRVSFLDGDGNVRSQPDHAVGGNPDKMVDAPARIEYRPWHLPAGRCFWTTALSLPGLLRYGYPIRRGRPEKGGR